MKTLITFFLFSTFLLINCSRNNLKNLDENDLKILELNGNIKSIKETSYKAIEKFGEVTKGEKAREHEEYFADSYLLFNEYGDIVEENTYHSDDILIEHKIYKYDKSGNRVQFTVQDNVNNTKTIYVYHYNKGIHTGTDMYNTNLDSLITRITFRYDEKGNLIEEDTFDPINNIFKNKVTYEYNNRGKLTEENHFNSDGSQTYKYAIKYNEKNNKIEEIYYNSDGYLDRRNIYKYDNQDNNIEQIEYISTGDTLKTYYKFDFKGKKMERFSCPTPNTLFTTKFTYNNKGYLIEEFTIRKSILIDFMTIEKQRYDYDKYDNWIRNIYYVNDKATYLIERDIDYYQ